MNIKKDKYCVAYCGLYCAACRGYISGKCVGCIGNEKASWCKIRLCCIEKKINSCADCDEYEDVNRCKKYNNLFSKLISLLFNSDRKKCIDYIKCNGYDGFVEYMSDNGYRTIKRK